MLHPLPIDQYEVREVLVPGDGGKPEKGFAIVLEGGPFPGRALEPQITVGDQEAKLVQILDGGARIRGILPGPPAPGDEIVVRYDPNMEGRARLRELEIRPLPKGC
jgi:hypothetical protein